jgi:hypothetical protein
MTNIRVKLESAFGQKRSFSSDEVRLNGRKAHSSLFLLTRYELTDRAIMLIQNKHLPGRSGTVTQVRARGRLLALFAILLLYQLEQCLRLAAVVKQNPSDGILSAVREIVRINV